jgi:hypothetical protein
MAMQIKSFVMDFLHILIKLTSVHRPAWTSFSSHFFPWCNNLSLFINYFCKFCRCSASNYFHSLFQSVTWQEFTTTGYSFSESNQNVGPTIFLNQQYQKKRGGAGCPFFNWCGEHWSSVDWRNKFPRKDVLGFSKKIIILFSISHSPQSHKGSGKNLISIFRA